MNIAEPILRHARLQGDAVALIDRNGSLTYGQLADQALRAASLLASRGVVRGDRVAICLADDTKQIIAILAVLCLGGVVLQINRRFRPTETARIVEELRPRLVIVRPDRADRFSCETVIIDEAWRSAIATTPGRDSIEDGGQAPCFFLASSGTTGLPRFPIRPPPAYRAHLAPPPRPPPPGRHQHPSCPRHLELRPLGRHRYLSGLNLYYAAGRIPGFATLHRGDTVILGPSLFSPAEFIELTRRHQATLAFIVPSALRDMLRAFGQPGLALPELQMLLTSGSPVRPEEKQAITARLTPRFFDIYGSAPIGYISVLQPKDLARPDSVGRPLPAIDLEIVGESGQRVAPGVEGRLRVRGPGLTSPVQAGAAADDFRDGWFYPGEIAVLDEDGYLFLRGRSSELIFRGGAKISPSELEEALQEHGSVLEAVVVARTLANNEQEAIAFVVASRPVSAGELLAHCRASLSSFKVPSHIHVVSSFPRTATGKVDKQALIAGNFDPQTPAD